MYTQLNYGENYTSAMLKIDDLETELSTFYFQTFTPDYTRDMIVAAIQAGDYVNWVQQVIQLPPVPEPEPDPGEGE